MADRILASTPFLRFIDRDGWAFVERANAHACVAIVALTPDRRLVLIEQFRPPLRGKVIELPAGLVGDEESDEPLEVAARRELLEETGYQASTMVRLPTCVSSAGISNEETTFFLAKDATRVAAGGGVGGEDIEVHAIAIDAVPAFIAEKQRAGVGVAAKVFAGLHFARY